MKRLIFFFALASTWFIPQAYAQAPTPTPRTVTATVQNAIGSSATIPTLKNGQFYIATTGTGQNLTVALYVGTTAGNKLIFTGVPGPAGAAGVAGAQGAAGVAGAAAMITVGTTTTGAAGTNATVTNTGTNSAAIFNFTIPRGATGATGTTGAQGIPGVVTATAPLTYDAPTQTVAITPATTTAAGSMSAADKTKLNSLGVVSITDGNAPIPIIAAGASSDVTVTFTTPMTGTTFIAVPTILAGTLNLNLSQPTVKSVTATQAVITLKNNALISLNLGATLQVIGYGKVQ